MSGCPALGIDAGAVRVGLAASDPTGFLASPVTTLTRRDPARLWGRLAGEIEARRPACIVVGLPRRLDGSEGDAAAAARTLAAEIGRRTRLPVEMWDEWFTTVAAERALIDGGKRRRERRETIDAVAASLMLQGWLDRQRMAPRKGRGGAGLRARRTAVLPREQAASGGSHERRAPGRDELMPQRLTRRGERGGAGVVFAIIGVIVFIVVASGAGTIFYAREQLGAPSEAHGKPVAVEVRSGEALDEVITDLASHGLIRNSFWFGQYARLKGLGEQLRRGRFLLDDGMAAGTVITVLESNPTPSRRSVALAEGLTAEQMGHVVGRAGLGITQEQYLAEVRGGQFSAPFLTGRPAGASLEGFLFPDTYEIPEHSTAHNVIQMQLDNFGRHAITAGVAPGNGGYPVVIIASILEREAKFDEDRPLVAGVITNRLARGMDLQVDATVLYGLHKLGRDGDRVDVQTDTPYNSYIHPGLPPTPISNPGLKALEAAAHPSATSSVFYVSDGCGHNHYSTTQVEHDRAVAQYVGRACTERQTPSPSPGE